MLRDNLNSLNDSTVTTGVFSEDGEGEYILTQRQLEVELIGLLTNACGN